MEEGFNPVDAVILGLRLSVLPTIDGRERDTEGRSDPVDPGNGCVCAHPIAI